MGAFAQALCGLQGGAQAAAAGAATGASTSVQWGQWNAVYNMNVCVTTSNQTILHADGIWGNWNQDYVITGGAQTGLFIGGSYQNHPYQQSPQPSQSPEETQRQLAESERRRSTAEQAQKKATELLLAHLSPKQREEFAAGRHFTIHTRNGEREYRVGYGKAGNIKLIRDGKPVEQFCIHPDAPCPTEDVMLAQKLLLEADEDQFLKIANRTVLAA